MVNAPALRTLVHFWRHYHKINAGDRRESAIDKQYLTRHLNSHNGPLVRHSPAVRPSPYVHACCDCCAGYAGHAGHACCVDRSRSGGDDHSARKTDDCDAAACDVVVCDVVARDVVVCDVLARDGGVYCADGHGDCCVRHQNQPGQRR